LITAREIEDTGTFAEEEETLSEPEPATTADVAGRLRAGLSCSPSLVVASVGGNVARA
jgi:hypothetical protein